MINQIICVNEKVADIMAELEQSGTFFTVDFYKADDSFRTMNARFIKGATRSRYINKGYGHTCLTVLDITKQAYRQIPLDRVSEIRANGKIYIVK